MSASPSPVKPRPTRRFAIASWRCGSSGQAVTSSTLSSMRTAVSTTLPEFLEVEPGFLGERMGMNLVKSIEPRQQQP